MENYLDTENKILGDLLRAPLESKSLRQISLNTGLSYVTVHKLIPLLTRKKLLKLEKKGKASLISIDFDNSPVSNLSSAMLYEVSVFLRKKPQLTLLLRDIEDALAGSFYSLVLFGSYAKGNPAKDSDIDLLFIIPSRKDIEEYQDKVNKTIKLHALKLHINVVAIGDFMDMLNERDTVGRSAFQNGIVFFGTEQYYALVKKYVGKKGY